METNEVRDIIGLLFGFFIMFAMGGWLYYSFYLRFEWEKRKKQPRR